MKHEKFNDIIFIVLIVVYIGAQFVIGTWHPDEKRFIYNAPADSDYLYYSAIARAVVDGFPPENPSFAGIRLTQPFVQYYPVGLLGLLINAFNGMRVMNVAYLVVFGLLLRKYFPRRYALPLIILFAGSALPVDLNSAGTDFISRGYTHVPYFILLFIALYSRVRWTRMVSIFVAAFINGYLMLMVVPFLALWTFWHKDRELFYVTIAALAGLGTAGLLVSSAAAEKPFYFIFAESLRLAPVEILCHAAPIIVLAILYRHPKMTLLLAIAVVFGMIVQYNPFFPIFLCYFAGALIIAEGHPVFGWSRRLGYLVTILLLAGFVITTGQKFKPSVRAYYPRIDHRIEPAIAWARENTAEDAAFLAVTADARDIALIMTYRNVYLGAIGHMGHLGLNWPERYKNTVDAFGAGPVPPEVDYIFYGPVEKKYFPGARIDLPEVYRDRDVTIYSGRPDTKP